MVILKTEGLGITNISIDFNSSMSPIVVIDFIDVRGSAIFQNEANLKMVLINTVLFSNYHIHYLN
jgi:hypothetical protein